MDREPRKKPIPIYTTPGDWSALLVFPHIFSSTGEWIGWVTSTQQVYSVHGHYVGWLTKDPRILRKRTYDHSIAPLKPPRCPPSLRPPVTVPLPPLMAALQYS